MSSFNYIAILGRQPGLGLVELESLLGVNNVRRFGAQTAEINSELEIGRLGGVVKLGVVLYRGPVTSLQNLPFDLGPLPLRASKTPFALSVYGGRETQRSVLAAGLVLKKQLRARGSARLITPGKGTEVSAAELKHNRVLEDGFELMVVVSGNELVVARTTGVQDIDWYSRRDYGRPARSAKVGMLPPKLAQVLINSTSAPVVADPFCGTGVVLQEALLLGREAHGSDLAPEMVAASRENLPWLERAVGSALPHWSVEAADARTVELPEGCAVVSEGYLGPNLSRSPTPAELDNIRIGLKELYRVTLANVARQLESGGEVSICVPAWKTGKAWQYLGLVDELPDLGYTLKGFEAASNPLLYSRDDQLVGRQLFFLRKL
jgi:tRNA (guanine10-N2)-dimethyltransferase